MITIGSHEAPRLERERPEREAAREQHGREADREQVDRERPDDVEQPRQHAVDRAAEEAGSEADQRREEAGEQRRGHPDQQRVAAAVQQARRDVAALVVGAEEVVLGSQVGPIGVTPSPSPPSPAASPAPSCRRRSSSRRGSTERLGVRDGWRTAAPRGRAATITASRPSIAIAIRLRASRRRASAHGLAPAGPTGGVAGAPPSEGLAHRRPAAGPGSSPALTRSLLHPRLVDQPVELLAEGEVPDALRHEVDVLRVNSVAIGAASVTGLSIFAHCAFAASSSVTPSFERRVHAR